MDLKAINADAAYRQALSEREHYPENSIEYQLLTELACLSLQRAQVSRKITLVAHSSRHRSYNWQTALANCFNIPVSALTPK